MTDDQGATTASPKPRVSAYAWYALILFVIVYIFNFIDRQIVSILAESIKADLKLDDAQIGFLYGTAFAVFYALFGIPLGRLADSWYRGRLMAIGLALWSSMTAASGFAQSFGMLAAARVPSLQAWLVGGAMGYRGEVPRLCRAPSAAGGGG